MSESEKWIRHGDVYLIPCNEIPEDAKSLGNRKELAYGEVTGHAHRINVGELFETKNGDLYLKVPELSASTLHSSLSHEEHKTIPIKRNYRVCIKRQYSPDGWSPVHD